MVGIGGGVPSPANDIRLGDVVVGTRVMPYDLSKAEQNGLTRTEDPKLLRDTASTVVSDFRARHYTDGLENFKEILEKRSQQYAEYHHPGLLDHLFLPSCSHTATQTAPDPSPATGPAPHFENCGSCDQSKIVKRAVRSSNDPLIHYGAIASGSQVVKNAIDRDRYAREFDAICFEMEVAGLVDSLPCIPIRGICDYSDSHKNKDWQKYAALVAASFARDIVEHLPIDSTASSHVLGQDSNGLHNFEKPLVAGESTADRRQCLLDSLQFEQMDSRKTTIPRAYAKTCRWILGLPEYKMWLDHRQRTTHHGFIWIRGKPGVGKSTLMKFAYGESRKKDHRGLTHTVSFFFNARGDALEKTIIGMYRSLLYQILEIFPDLQAIFDDSDVVPRAQEGCPSLSVLKQMLWTATLKLNQRSVNVYIDALDECDEQQVTDMVRFFEQLTEQATEEKINFRACFSSRHYPCIEMRVGLRLILEDIPGHTADLTDFIRGELRISDRRRSEELVAELLRKSSGVFLWVVLVIDILNKEDRRGGFALLKRLSEVPDGLTELFKDLIRRDAENIDAFRLCVVWILSAARPLRPKEYHHAIWSGLAMDNDADLRAPAVGQAGDLDESTSRPIITSSKGLAEITRGKKPTVQFIHESVRDFLIKDGGLFELWPDLGMCWPRTSHEILRRCCSFYLENEKSNRENERSRPDKQAFPLLEYAAHNLLYHAEGAAEGADDVHEHQKFLSDFPLLHWIQVYNATEEVSSKRYHDGTTLLYILAYQELPRLIQFWLKANPCISALDGDFVVKNKYQTSFFAAMASGNKSVIAAALRLPSTILNGSDITEGLKAKSLFTGYRSRTPLTWAAGQGLTVLVQWLLESGADLKGRDRWYQTALEAAVQGEGDHEQLVKSLLDEGADANTRTHKHPAAAVLQLATKRGNYKVVKLLLERGASVDHADRWGKTALMVAVGKNDLQTVSLLLEHKSNVDAADMNGRTSIMWAWMYGYLDMTVLLTQHGATIDPTLRDSYRLLTAIRRGDWQTGQDLLEAGAKPNIHDAEGWTPLALACSEEKKELVEMLIERGADINEPRRRWNNPLIYLCDSGRSSVEMIALILGKGADVNVQDMWGWTQLMNACRSGRLEVVEMLLEAGADMNLRDSDGRTALGLAASRGKSDIVERLRKEGAIE
jgi:ankyrin repeat protein/nucleoside phosphorylase